LQSVDDLQGQGYLSLKVNRKQRYWFWLQVRILVRLSIGIRCATSIVAHGRFSLQILALCIARPQLDLGVLRAR
jgi:hypothetical protein